MAPKLYGALRDGLAHGFDTKHILAEGKEHQICLNSTEPQQFTFRDSDRGLELLLKQDGEARERLMKARQRHAQLDGKEAAAWRKLVQDAGY